MLTCLYVRRRIGAYLDGALEENRAQSTSRHLSGCAGCQREAEHLRRLRALVQRSLVPRAGVAEPDWSGFWPAIVRGVEDARLRAPAQPARSESWWRPRWALSGAVAAVAIVSFTLWQTMFSSIAPQDPVVVSSAHTEDPRGTVMVYSTHDKDVTVVWVLGLEEE